MITIRQNLKTVSPFTIVAKLFFTCKKFNFVNDEVAVGRPKLGHTTGPYAWKIKFIYVTNQLFYKNFYNSIITPFYIIISLPQDPLVSTIVPSDCSIFYKPT